VTYFDGVSERDHDGDWQSFWNGDDENRDAADDEADEVADVGVIPRRLIDDELVDAEMHDQCDQVQAGYDDSCIRICVTPRNTVYMHLYFARSRQSKNKQTKKQR